jgi:hypothetical protein
MEELNQSIIKEEVDYEDGPYDYEICHEEGEPRVLLSACFSDDLILKDKEEIMMNSYVGSTAVDVTYDRDRTMSPKSS